MEQSDHDYLVEVLSGSGGTNPDKGAQSYAESLVAELEFNMSAAEVAYLRYLEGVLYRKT